MALAGAFLERGGRSVGTEENKAAQRRIIDEVINGKDLDLADDLFSEGHTLYPESSGVGRGPEGMKQAIAGLHEEFPDIHVEIEDILAEGDMVAVRLTFRGPRPHRRVGRLARDGLRALLRGQGRGELGGDGHRARVG
jgi:predicted SnoaL-like aldol condensation-catalyzing enzyme